MISIQGLQQRALLLQAIRTFFTKRGYLEVETPIRLPLVLPEAHIEPFLSEGACLQTSPELCMKLLLARGCAQIFQLCHCFRKEEQGRFHQSEFTMLEWYRQNLDYRDLMAECEALLSFLVAHCQDFAGVENCDTLLIQGKKVAVGAPWQYISVAEAFARYAPLSAKEALTQDLFDQYLVEYLEPKLGWEKPCFLYDYPLELASLARPSTKNPEIAERFELYIGGIELANGFSELVDAEVQRERFEEELVKIAAQGRAGEMPALFLDYLPLIDSAAGIALGVDRLVMLLMGKESIQDVLAFPEGFLQSG